MERWDRARMVNRLSKEAFMQKYRQDHGMVEPAGHPKDTPEDLHARRCEMVGYRHYRAPQIAREMARNWRKKGGANQ